MRRLAPLLLITPALAQPTAGPRRCPTGQFVAGFEADGRLICEAPTPPPRPARPPRPVVAPLPTDAQGRIALPAKRLVELLTDPEQLARSARVVPYIKAGEAVGFRVFGIRHGSIAAALGLKNGDVIHTVAGLPLDSPDKALQAYSAVKALQPGATLEITGTRRGQPLRLTYSIE